MLKLADLVVGKSLMELNKPVTQDNINLYAEASGDFNPIHLDPEFGKKMQLGGTIAHGMMILAYISELMGVNFGNSWLSTGKLNVRFKEAARPGDVISVSGRITNVERETDRFSIYSSVICQNQNNQIIITGDTEVRLKTL